MRRREEPVQTAGDSTGRQYGSITPWTGRTNRAHEETEEQQVATCHAFQPRRPFLVAGDPLQVRRPSERTPPSSGDEVAGAEYRPRSW